MAKQKETWPAHFSSVIPRMAFRSALGFLGSTFATDVRQWWFSRGGDAEGSIGVGRNQEVGGWREKESSDVPPLAGFGASEGCAFAHSALACWIRDSLCLYSCSAWASFSRFDIEAWW